MEESQRQIEIRTALDKALVLLREEKDKAHTVEQSRAISVAITQLEIASMCAVRSFYATEPYTPLKKLKEVKPA